MIFIVRFSAMNSHVQNVVQNLVIVVFVIIRVFIVGRSPFFWLLEICVLDDDTAGATGVLSDA